MDISSTNSRVRQAWAEGRTALCTQVKSIDPAIMELTASMGFDCIWTDLEHGPRTDETFACMARAARVFGVDVMARPAKWEYMRMGRLLEVGARGILYPRCDHAKEAREVVRWAKFPPEGERGFDGGNPDNLYGAVSTADYVVRANRETWIAIQVESPAAVPHTREIAEIDGVDCIFFGPGDYSLLAGLSGGAASTEVLKVCEQVCRATLATGKHFASLAFSADHARQLSEMGASLVALSGDYRILRAGLSDLYSQLKTSTDKSL